MSAAIAQSHPAVETSPDEVVLRVEDLETSFPGAGGVSLNAVRGVSFELRRGKTMVLLGESGSGKSVTARSVMGLYGDKAAISGSIRLGDSDLLGLDEHAMRGIRGRRIALVPQDPTGALDPLRRIGSQISEVLRCHGVIKGRANAEAAARSLLRLVGIPDPSRVFRAFPNELSGGMRQRAVIAIAVSCEPDILIADEPTTALDVTIQSQILELFGSLQQRLGMAVLLVTHDVGVAEQVADEVGVMYAGRLVEQGPADDVLTHPSHPYTAALLDSLPSPEIARGSLRPIQGQPPMVGESFVGCSFASRCPRVIAVCHDREPQLEPVAEGHLVACEAPA